MLAAVDVFQSEIYFKTCTHYVKYQQCRASNMILHNNSVDQN